MNVDRMRLVIVESPYAGDIQNNLTYTRKCVRDCLKRNEAPFASHLLYTQDGVLDDNLPADRILGMEAGFSWLEKADATVVYTDHGISKGMQVGIQRAELLRIPVEYRSFAILVG